MGTSSAFTGPEKNPLLPDDFNDNSWKNAKTEMSKYITGTSNDISRLFGKYVKASGGNNNLSSKAKGGKIGFINTVNVLNQINRDGLIPTLDSLRISTEGKSWNEILSEVTEAISPAGSSKEESVAREAVIETMAHLYNHIEENNIDINQLELISGSLYDELLSTFLTNYITGLLLTDLGYGIEKYADDSDKLEKKEQELRDYVDNSVYIVLKEKRLEMNPEEIVDKIFTDIFELLGGYYE